METERVRSGS
uniref:Uncharacterized protein n=1 Tax=Anguilla anguilla TaxID=7936 RepID=A0A0E9Q7E8_ANGAN